MISVEPATRPSLRLASDQQIFQAKDRPLSGPSQTCVYAYVKTTRHLYYEMYGISSAFASKTLGPYPREKQAWSCPAGLPLSPSPLPCLSHVLFTL